MKKNKNIIDMLNMLYSIELESHSLYITLSSQLEVLGVMHISKFLKNLANDKIGPHNERVFNYLISFNETIKIKNNLINKKLFELNIKSSTKDTSIYLLENALENELSTRKLVSEIANKALNEKDFETFEFIQWFVKDYIKDISEINQLLLKLKDKDISVFDIKLS